jgi:HPt (histidine-containing phosphotransfer) domain-containing protein
VTGAAASLTADVKDAAQSLRRAAAGQATEFAFDVGHELKQTAEQQKTRGVDALKGFAHAIQTAAGELESQSPGVARHIREAAKNVEGLSNNLRNRSVDELMHAASDLARSQPGVFIAGAVAAGFALSRFLKSSAPDDSARPSSPASSAHGSPATRTANPYYPAGSVSPKI